MGGKMTDYERQEKEAGQKSEDTGEGNGISTDCTEAFFEVQCYVAECLKKIPFFLN